MLKSLVPTESSQDKGKFSCPFQSTDNFPEWKLAFSEYYICSCTKAPTTRAYYILARIPGCTVVLLHKIINNWVHIDERKSLTERFYDEVLDICQFRGTSCSLFHLSKRWASKVQTSQSLGRHTNWQTCKTLNFLLVWCYSECISTLGRLEKYAWPRWDSNLRPLELEPTWRRSSVGRALG